MGERAHFTSASAISLVRLLASTGHIAHDVDTYPATSSSLRLEVCDVRHERARPCVAPLFCAAQALPQSIHRARGAGPSSEGARGAANTTSPVD
jgi:hypothetical protein